jgi:hypothetical protein
MLPPTIFGHGIKDGIGNLMKNLTTKSTLKNCGFLFCRVVRELTIPATGRMIFGRIPIRPNRLQVGPDINYK